MASKARAAPLLLCAAALVAARLASAQPRCGDGSTATCPDGGALHAGFPPCAGGPPRCADGSAPTPPAGGAQPGGGRPGGGKPGGGKPGGGGPAAGGSSKRAAPLLGDVGTTTASGRDARTGATFAPGENIYGPFEAGFGEQQDFILEAMGCSPASLGYVAGGIDTNTSEKMMAHRCGVALPREESAGPRGWISLLDECGGHTREYHFHERMSCLYDGAAKGHSTQIGKGNDGGLLYGKFELEGQLPQLDACGGHFGPTPESREHTYHYHVQDGPPFTFGCYGPNDDGSLVTVEQCRSFYPSCDGNVQTLETSDGPVEYDDWCPCYDARGSNTGRDIQELPATQGGFMRKYSASAAQGHSRAIKWLSGLAAVAASAAGVAFLYLAARRARQRVSAPARRVPPEAPGDSSQLTATPTE